MCFGRHIFQLLATNVEAERMDLEKPASSTGVRPHPTKASTFLWHEVSRFGHVKVKAQGT